METSDTGIIERPLAKPTRSLRTRLLVLVLLAYLPAIVLFTVAATQERLREVADVGEVGQRLIRLARSGDQANAVASRRLLAGLAAQPEVRGDDRAAASAFLARLRPVVPAYSNIGVVDREGRLLASAVPDPERSGDVRRDWFSGAIETGAFAVGAYGTLPTLLGAGVEYVLPVLDESGAPDGAVFASLDLAWLERVAAQSELPGRSIVAVFDGLGRLLVQFPSTPEADLPPVSDLANLGQGTFESVGAGGDPRSNTFGRLAGEGDGTTYVAVGIAGPAPASRIPGSTSGRDVVALLLVPTLALLAAWIGSDLLILRRLRRVKHVAERLGRGHLEERAEVDFPDEIGVTADALNRMADRLAGLIEQGERAKAELAGDVERLVETRTREATLLATTVEMLQACLTVEEAGNVISRMSSRLFREGGGGVYLLSPSRNVVERLSGWGHAPGGSIVELFAPDSCWALRLGRAHQVVDPRKDLVCAHVAGEVRDGTVCIPLVANGETLGVYHLSVGASTGEAAMDEAALRMAVSIGESISMAMSNIQLREQLRNQSIRDPLTGLFNRRYLEETLERELPRAARQGTGLAVLVMDLDHFKQYNDTFGHDAGDAVLQSVSEVIRTTIRVSDVPCRYGGEEFVVAMPDTAVEDARRRAEEIRRAARELSVAHRGLSLGSVTLSIGVAGFPDHGRTHERILRAADAALYRSKGEGRDRVTVAVSAGADGIASGNSRIPTADPA